MKVDLRPYQAAAFDKAREAIRQGAKRILVVAPTGSGKTVLGSALMEMVREKHNRASFVVDRLSAGHRHVRSQPGTRLQAFPRPVRQR